MKTGICCQMKDLEISVARLLSNSSKSSLKPPTITQARIIDYILSHKNQKVYQKDLEKALNLRRATVSEVLNTMEKKGIIERHKNPNDTRCNQICLKELDKDRQQEFQKNIQNIEKILTENISEEELEAFSLTLKKMQTNLKNKYNTQGGQNV